MEAPAWEHKDPEWFRAFAAATGKRSTSPTASPCWSTEMRDLIALLERKTGRRFDAAKLDALMERINEQEGYLWRGRRSSIGEARPCPVSIAEQMPNTMIPQWHRGSDWAVAHARRFRDEVQRAGRRRASAPPRNERLRLMWIGAGLWHDPGFYQALEETLGAVFVWSMYLPFAGPAVHPRDSRAGRWRRWPAASAR